jgi:hypothetical protein
MVFFKIKHSSFDASIPGGISTKISSFKSLCRNAFSTSMILAFNFHTNLAINYTLKDTSFTTGAKLSLKSTPGTWLYPQATNQARKTPFRLTLSTQLLLTHQRPTGISSLLTFFQTPQRFISLNSLWMASLHFYLTSSFG